MRSAVSAILSESPETCPMAFPDYDQVASDHRRALIQINALGSRLTPKLFHKVHARITRFESVVVVKPHQAVAGAALSSRSDNEQKRNFYVRYTCRPYPVENNEWGEFQYHRSRLGMISVGAYTNTQELYELIKLHEANKAQYGQSVLDSKLIAFGVDDGEEKGASADDRAADVESLTNGSDDHFRILFYQGTNFEDTLEADLVDFLGSLFNCLESKRLELMKEKQQDRLTCLCAPFEKKDFVGLDMESRTNRKRAHGRHRKLIGDLCLLCDCLPLALQHYEAAIEILRACNDWIWLAGALEGCCSVAVISLYPNIKRSSAPQRNCSFTEARAGITCSSSSSADIRLCINSNGRPLEADTALTSSPLVQSMKSMDIVDKYREIVTHYSKYRHAGVVETEASIKAVQVLTQQRNFLSAAEFLQNVVFINLQMNDTEKIHRFVALAKLYQGIGFHRKAAFYLRVAAMRCVAPLNTHPDWSQCYSLLLKTTSGYSLDLSCAFKRSHELRGWPVLQIQLMQELIGTARRLDLSSAAVRHMTYLLEILFDLLSETEKLDFSTQLSQLSGRCGALTEASVSVDNGLLLPPVAMYKIPLVSSFEPMPLSQHMMPHRRKTHDRSDSGVFVFTPIQFNTSKTASDPSLVKFQWVEGDVANVNLSLFNTLPTELKVRNLALLHEGVEFEAFPSVLSLAPLSGPHEVTLAGMPKGVGLLKIVGYTCTVLGLKSCCKLARIGSDLPPFYSITVLPSLPQLGVLVRWLTEASAEALPADHVVTVYDGERCHLELSLTNISTLRATDIRVSCKSHPPRFVSGVAVTQDDQLCLDSGQTATVGVQFLVKMMKSGPCDSVMDCNKAAMNRNEPSRWSGASRKSNASSTAASSAVSTVAPSATSKAVEVKFSVTICYSGGSGQDQGYYRELSHTVRLHIRPSAQVTMWDVLPSETISQNYLVLDITNLADCEMDLSYGQGKVLTIEPSDSCRIPVPVDKFIIAEKTLKSKQLFCSQHLSSTLQIGWSLAPPVGRRGLVSLSDIILDADMMSSLDLCPVAWTVCLNGLSVQELNVDLGEDVLLEASVENDFDCDVCGVFRVQCCMNGGKSSSVADQLVAGLMLFSQEESPTLRCGVGQAMHFCTTMLPLSPGQYDLSLSCTIQHDDEGLHPARSAPSCYVSRYPKLSVCVNVAGQ